MSEGIAQFELRLARIEDSLNRLLTVGASQQLYSTADLAKLQVNVGV